VIFLRVIQRRELEKNGEFGVIASIDSLVGCFRYDDVSDGTVVRRWYKSLSSR